MSLPPLSFLSPPPTHTCQYSFSIDRGGTFTDVYCQLPHGLEIVYKLLSEDPLNYPDAPTEGIRRILNHFDTPHSNIPYPRGEPIKTSKIASIRMGTTVATNALLERKGAPNVLLITKGFKDLLSIGNQSRPDIFDLQIKQLSTLYDHVIEVDERVRLFSPTYDDAATITEPIVTTLTNEVS